MKTISLCMIVKNEEKYIDKCLSSIYDIVDEIIIVDTGSTDDTKEICKKYTNDIYDFEWDYDFSKARNMSFEKATKDYILWLDADDMFKEEDRLKLKQLKENMDGSVDVYSSTYNYRHDENGICKYSFLRQRIVRNIEQNRWSCIVHELLEVKEDVEVETDIIVTHMSNHDNGKKYISFFEKKMSLGHILNSREKYFYGGELMVVNEVEKAEKVLKDFLSDEDYTNEYEISRAYNYLANLYKNQEKYKLAIKNYLCQMAYSEPNIQTISDIVNCYMELNDYKSAKNYCHLLLKTNIEKVYFLSGLGLTSEEDMVNKRREIKINTLLCLCVIAYKLGDIKRAIEYNDTALSFSPNNESARFNKQFFDKIKER